MIYKLQNGGIVKLQNAGTTMPSVEDAILRAGSNQSAKEKAEKQVASEKPKYTYVNPYDYLHGGREATEDAAKQDKYTVENLGGSKEEAEAAYNTAKENAAKQLAGTTATGLGTVALLGLSGGAAGPVAADIVNTGFGAHGLYNALSGNGIQKTIRLANQGDTGGTVKSGAGDLLDLSMGLHAAKLGGNLGKSMLAGQSLGNAYRGNVAGRELSNGVRSFNVSKNPFYSNPTVVLTIDHLYKEHPELATIGPKEAYSQYYKTIFPASKVQIPYAHGTRGDLSKGLEGSTKVSYTAAPETIGRNDFYLNLQPEASLQYADGIGVPEGFTGNKDRFWPLKEILGKPYKSDSGMFEPIQLRRQIPNRAGQFSRVKNADGTYSGHGKLLEEYKAELGMQDLSDKEFLQKFGIKDGETFEQWVAENKQKFSDIYNSGNYHGLYHVKVDASNPLTINGGNTYYSERGIGDKMNAGKNDILLHNNAANEFGSDVMVVKDVDPSKVRILGSDPDKQAFANFMNGHNVSFTPTPQKFVSTVHFDPRVKPLSRPISEAEKMGIPKNERPMYDPEVFQKAKLFAEEYGYPEPKTPTEIKDMYRRHNTFFRTVGDLDRVYFPENYESLPDEFKALSLPEQRKFLASRGYPAYYRGYLDNIEGPFSDEFVFVSPSLEENSDYFINDVLDNTVKLQRPFSLRDPKKGHIDADWRIHPANSGKGRGWPKGRIEIGNASPSREFKVSTKHLIPVDIAKQDDLGTLLPQYFRKRINDAVNKDGGKRPNGLQKDYNGNYEIDYLGILPEKFNYKQGGILKAQNGLQSITAQSDATRVAKTPEPEFGVPPEDLTNEEDNVDNVKYNPYNDKYVREFFDYDVLPRYMRENPNATAEEIEAVKNAYTDPQLIGKLKKDTLGMAKGGDKGGFLGIPFSLNRHAKYNSKYKLNRPTLVHENTHLYRQGVLGHIGIGKTTYPFKGLYAPNVYGLYRGSGYTPKEASYLQNAYNLDGFSFGYHGNNEKHFKLIESGTTNAEVRYRLGKELYDKTGKRPTIDELDNYIKNYSGDLGDLVGNSNAYGEKAQMNMMEDYFNTLNPNRENRTFEEERRIIEERKEELDQKEQEGNDKLKDALIHVADNGTIDQIPQNTTYGRKGGILKAQKGTFENFGNTLPENQRDSTDFNVRRYWELNGKPFDFKEAIRKGMYKKEKDGYHANSIAFNEETGEYEFMKSPNHPTINFELDGYNSPKAKKFRNKYQLDTTSIPGKYILKQQQGGFVTPMTNQFTTKLMEILNKYLRKDQPEQKAVGTATGAYNKPSKIVRDGGDI